MPEEPSTKRTIFGFIALVLLAMFGDWLELALGIVMIFGSVLIAVGFWLWLGNAGWWISAPLIAVNIALTGGGVFLVRKAQS